MIVLPSTSSGFINSFKSFPYLPRSISNNNSLSPNHQFINLPTNGGVAKWTEYPPTTWGQFGPYYNLFLKFYLKSDEGDEVVPDGGGRVHALKAASFGSSLGALKTINVSKNNIGVSNNVNDWSLSFIDYSVSITTQTYVNFGCFYKVLKQDSLRSLNFGAIALYFTKGIRKSYLNYSVIHGGGVNLLGNSSTYTYINSYDPFSTYSAYAQWIGQPIIKFKKLAEINQNSVFNQWQFLNYQVAIPTFVSSPEDDGATGKADSCTIMICFGENNSYLDDGSGLNTGAVQFLYPFLSLT